MRAIVACVLLASASLWGCTSAPEEKQSVQSAGAQAGAQDDGKSVDIADEAKAADADVPSTSLENPDETAGKSVGNRDQNADPVEVVQDGKTGLQPEHPTNQGVGENGAARQQRQSGGAKRVRRQRREQTGAERRVIAVPEGTFTAAIGPWSEKRDSWLFTFRAPAEMVEEYGRMGRRLLGSAKFESYMKKISVPFLHSVRGNGALHTLEFCEIHQEVYGKVEVMHKVMFYVPVDWRASKGAIDWGTQLPTLLREMTIFANESRFKAVHRNGFEKFKEDELIQRLGGVANSLFAGELVYTIVFSRHRAPQFLDQMFDFTP